MDTPLLAAGVQLVADLAAAQQYPANRRTVGDHRVIEHRGEATRDEIFHRAHRCLEPQHRLGREHHQRPVHPVQGMPAQQVEIVRRSGGLRHGHGALRAQLQEPFDAPGGVVWTLTLVTVRQQQDHVATLTPLGLTGGDELVDHRLCAIGEITELRLPQHQGLRVRH